MLKARLGERRERAKHVPVRRRVAERGLDAPDADQHGLVDAVGALDRGERIGELRHFALADGDARGRDQAVEIGGVRLAVFGLPPHRREHAGVGRHAGKGAREGRAVDAARGGIRPKLRQERRKAIAVIRACERGRQS